MTSFLQGEYLSDGDLSLSIYEGIVIDGTYESRAVSPIEIKYEIRKFDYTTDTTGTLVGDETRVPINPDVGYYYSNMTAPEDVGDYMIRWSYLRDNSSSVVDQTASFDVLSKGVDSTYIN